MAEELIQKTTCDSCGCSELEPYEGTNQLPEDWTRIKIIQRGKTKEVLNLDICPLCTNLTKKTLDIKE